MKSGERFALVIMECMKKKGAGQTSAAGAKSGGGRRAESPLRRKIAAVAAVAEALPYIRRYRGRGVVVKYGGAAMADASLRRAFAGDVALLKLVGINPSVVHGGGPQINDALRRMGVESKFVGGMRRTDSATMDIVQMVLGGLVNQQIVQDINDAGARAVGLTGKDGGMLLARRLKLQSASGEVDIGLVGEVQKVDAAAVSLLQAADFIPVIAPIGADSRGGALNINADSAAARIAMEMKAAALLLLTNTAGVLNKKGEMIPELTAAEAKKLIKSGAVDGGMKPKVECAIAAVDGGVPSCRIIDGTAPHALLLEVFTDAGAGTQIVR